MFEVGAGDAGGQRDQVEATLGDVQNGQVGDYSVDYGAAGEGKGARGNQFGVTCARAVFHQDDDAAGPATPGHTRPPLRSWDQHEDLRATLVDGFNALLAVQAGEKGKKPKPTPRPETGRDRAKRARDAATVSELFEAFTPGR